MNTILQQSRRALAIQLTLILLLINAGIGLYLMRHPPPVLDRAAPMFVYTDGWTESLTRDAASNYRRNGLFHDVGLPVISDEWLKRVYFPHATIAPGQEHLYLHQPSVPYMLAGAAALMFGTDNGFALRVIPLGINALLLFIFLNGVFTVIADARARLLFVACFLAIPVGWAQMYGTANINYAHFVLLALAGVLLPAFGAARPPAWRNCITVAGLGFLGGCFTFDYFFVMCLASLAVACLYHGESVFAKGPWRAAAFGLCAACAAGFALAHALHLLQVAAYLGSLKAAVAEMWNVARYRTDGDCSQYHFLSGVSFCHPNDIVGRSPVWGRLVVFFDYLLIRSAFDSAGRPVLFLPFYLHVLWAWKSAVRFWDAAAKRRFVAAIAISVFACMLWPVVMPNHAAIHTFFIPHQFYLIYLVLVLLMVGGRNRAIG